MRYLFVIFLPLIVFAQNNFRIEYERRMFIKLDGNSEQIKLMQEQFSKPTYIELLGNETICSLKEFEKVTNTQGPKYTMNVIGMEKDLQTYLDFKTNQSIVSKDLDGKLFLITSKIPKLEWILSRDTKTINGYEAKKATLQKDGFAYEVWYSTKIKSKCGPELATGLPGLVLEFTRTHIEQPLNYTTFKLVQLEFDNATKFNKPTKGRPLTEDEFSDYRKEFDKRLQESMQGVDRD